ncbi:hypothetical protein FACS1894211_03710 [Clostridia bacterium]|nr:hypothetical protein FACS1894211_03710 [Clostridia bacterium]
MKKLIACFAFLCFLATGCASTVPPPPENEPPTGETVDSRPALHGIGEPFFNSAVKGFTFDVGIDLAAAIGVKSYRAWLEQSIFVNWQADVSVEQSAVLNAGAIAVYRGVFQRLKANGVLEIVGHGILFPRVAGTVGKSINAVPRPASAEYGEFLLKMKACYKALAAALPEVDVWEVGNESNANEWMHPPEYEIDSSVRFTQADSARVCTDFLYYALQGVKEANPKALVINPGWSPYLGPVAGLQDVKNFQKLIYENIKSGAYPSYGSVKSVNNRDYFDGVSWHPYYYHTTPPDAQWRSLNDDIYEVMREYGDGDVGVWFTEVGFTSGHPGFASTETQAGWYALMFGLVDEMPYVHTVNVFRMFECAHDAIWGGEGEVKFGMFSEPVSGIGGFVPNAKAFALQAIYGGTGDLSKYASAAN